VSADKLLHAEEPNRVSNLINQAYLLDTVEVSINAYLVRNNDKLILIDAGIGALFGAAHGGKLIDNLKAAGYCPEQVTDILITHIYLDHSGGLSVNNVRQFHNAIVHVNQKELNFWMKHLKPKKNEARGITDNRPAFGALEPYHDAGKVIGFEGDKTLFDGIRTKEVAGHTVFILESEKEKLLFWGDLIHIEAVQFHGPEIHNYFDFDKEQAEGKDKQVTRTLLNRDILLQQIISLFPVSDGLRKMEMLTGGCHFNTPYQGALSRRVLK
jgi:glyoxylase-like metal-dependent hydrolase (beta-lactamase superfamily II)